jgi:hypothetical protein
MKKILTAFVAATVIGASALAMSDAADAQWRYGGYRGVGYRGYGYGAGFRGYGYGAGYPGYGYGSYGIGTAVVVAPVIYYPRGLFTGYSGCGCW